MPHVSINGTFAKCVWKNKSFHLDAFFFMFAEGGEAG